jgi:hypothetical protein
MKSPALVLALALACAIELAPAAAQYPPVGEALTELPADAVPITYRGSRYYIASGAWFQQVVAGFVVVAPPPGIVVPQLPAPYSVLNISGGALFRANGVYYAAAPGGFAVVPAPGAGWYYCESVNAYYPAVSQCAEGWRVVPAMPRELR